MDTWRLTSQTALLLAAMALSSCATRPAPSPALPTPPAAHPASPPAPAETERAEAQQPVLVGYVTKVTDGDTIHVQLSSGPIIVRFHSIDAPEHDQPWGDDAKAALARRIAGREVALEVESQDRYERLVAVVYLGDENINAWMVQQGNAWAYRQYLDDKDYCVWEGIARATRRGLWSLPSGVNHAPWEWRAAKRDDSAGFTDYSDETVANCIAFMRGRGQAGGPPWSGSPIPPTPTLRPGECRIKGNISDSGKIYHVPGNPWYDRTQVDTSKGERWFCTEDEARAAGWRPPKN
jgi:endonuclease YncB( thermonuclease family)